LLLAERVACSSAPLLIFGERGSGRAALARHVHTLGSERGGDLWTVDCGAAVAAGRNPEPLFSLLAGRSGNGLSAGDTLLLKEVADLPLEAQRVAARLIASAGDPGAYPFHCRVIATTGRDLAAEARCGHVLQDLHAALSRITIYLPPLRQRRSDIPELARYFLERAAGPLGTPCRISEEALVLLWRYDWPGNVAELEAVMANLIRRAVGDLIRPHDLPAAILGSGEHGGARPANAKPAHRYRVAS
jgi:DNA-binding NtrC family response regulator